MGEDHILPISEEKELKVTASRLTPPPSSLTVNSGNTVTVRDVHFAFSNETLRDDYHADNRASWYQPEVTYEARVQSGQFNHGVKDSGWRRMVQNFTPSWFSVIMGTGIVSILLNILPYNGHWLRWISIVIFALNVFLFIAGCILSVTRYTMYPKTIKAVIFHSSASDVPDGSRYYRQHVLSRVCAGLGNMGCRLCTGIVVS